MRREKDKKWLKHKEKYRPYKDDNNFEVEIICCPYTIPNQPSSIHSNKPINPNHNHP
jgi:hypothetical protein